MSDKSVVLAGQRLGLKVLPDNAGWKNRFEIKSASSNRLYTIAQRKTGGGWGCSCPGWIRHRTCKHLKAILPVLEYTGSKKVKG